MQAQTTRPLAGTSCLSGSPQTQGFAWRICGANHLHETRGVLQVYNLEGQVLQLSTVEACLRYFQHFMICPIELRTNLQVIMSSHVIPCYPMSLVLVSRFNWFNVILCGLFFPPICCISRISISRISKKNHMTWSLWLASLGHGLNFARWIFECRRLMPLEKYVENLKQSCNFQLIQRCCGTMWYPANHRCSSSPYSVLMLVPEFQHSEEFFADLLVNTHRFSCVWRPTHV